MNAATLWNAAEAAAATGGRTPGAWAARGVSIDSRTITPGDLFIALAGPNFDGHDFVAQALARGAAAAVVSRLPDGVSEAGRLLLVDDTMAALNALGRAARERTQAKVVAVTGSVGKTGTKEALKLAFEAQARTHASVASFNNRWGVPLSLARMPRDVEFAVYELGMSRPGELAPLSELVRPHAAIVTTVEAVHLAFFRSVAEIAEAKAEVFTAMAPHGVAILNRDNAHYERLARAARSQGARVVAFGSHAEADARLIRVALHPDCCCISAEVCGQPVTYKVAAPGRHWAMNSLAVLAAVRMLDADLGLAALALARMTPPEGRGRRHEVMSGGGPFMLIDDSYNASPVATRAAIANLAGTPTGRRGRRIAVLGDMLELGEAAPGLHAELADDLRGAEIDLVFTAGADMAHLFAALPPDLRGVHAEDSAGLVAAVADAVRPGDAVLVKGSLGSRMAVVVAALLALGENGPPQAASG